MGCWLCSESPEKGHLFARLWCREATGEDGDTVTVLRGGRAQILSGVAGKVATNAEPSSRAGPERRFSLSTTLPKCRPRKDQGCGIRFILSFQNIHGLGRDSIWDNRAWKLFWQIYVLLEGSLAW